MDKLLLYISVIISTSLNAQPMKIITLENNVVEVTVLSESGKKQLLEEFSGSQDNSLRKKWTTRTYVISDGRLIIEFYDRQAVLLKSQNDFVKLQRVRFVKNMIYSLKKNISYKIELSHGEGRELVEKGALKKLSNLKSASPGYFDFEVYEFEHWADFILRQKSK